MGLTWQQAVLAAPGHLPRFTPAFKRLADAPTLAPLLTAAGDIGHQAGPHHVYVERALGGRGDADG